MMSEGNQARDASCCAACGVAEIDDVKLVPCDGCDLVRYCGVNCQRDHISRHLPACKKRVAELREELLFMQPDSSCYGDCPICSLPMPLDASKTTMYDCCSKVICNGCEYANDKREIEMKLSQSCPFCRVPLPKTKEEADKLMMKRVEANDPNAMWQQGHLLYNKGEYIRAFSCITKAAELGSAEAHYQLSRMFNKGRGVEEDQGKEIYHLEEAAICGHPLARYNLGVHEWNNNDNMERAVKHWIISATQGDDDSIKMLMKAYKDGFVEKEDLAATLRAHQAAVDATNSPQREEAKEAK